MKMTRLFILVSILMANPALAKDLFSKDSCHSLDQFIHDHWQKNEVKLVIPKPEGKWVKNAEIESKWKAYQASCPSTQECKASVNAFWASLNRQFADGCPDYQMIKTISALKAGNSNRMPASVNEDE
jgi:hypothetical protein